MKVTIIGGSGFIGTRIVDHFTQFKGYDFRIVDIREAISSTTSPPSATCATSNRWTAPLPAPTL